jgi:hypothetical protein
MSDTTIPECLSGVAKELLAKKESVPKTIVAEGVPVFPD